MQVKADVRSEEKFDFAKLHDEITELEKRVSFDDTTRSMGERALSTGSKLSLLSLLLLLLLLFSLLLLIVVAAAAVNAAASMSVSAISCCSRSCPKH